MVVRVGDAAGQTVHIGGMPMITESGMTMRLPWRRLLRVAVGLIAAAALAYGAAIGLFVALIVRAGCLFDCSSPTPNPAAAFTLLAVSAAAAASSVTTLAWALTSRTLVVLLRSVWVVAMALFLVAALLVAASVV